MGREVAHGLVIQHILPGFGLDVAAQDDLRLAKLDQESRRNEIVIRLGQSGLELLPLGGFEELELIFIRAPPGRRQGPDRDLRLRVNRRWIDKCFC